MVLKADDTRELKKMAESPFIGSWKLNRAESNAPAKELENAPPVIVMTPYGPDGLTSHIPAFEVSLSIRFDGQDYAVQGPGVPNGAESSGRWIDAHAVLVTDKFQGKAQHSTEWRVSADGEKLTMTVMEPGKESYVLLYDLSDRSAKP